MSNQNQSYTLADCIARNQKHPQSFMLPSLPDDLVGTTVKLIFQDIHTGAGERMWVKVVSKQNNIYKGLLDNMPFYIDDLIDGDEVEFEAKHVADIYRPSSQAPIEIAST
jgi:uncharacterized protein YegJ (DUF2314 family)